MLIEVTSGEIDENSLYFSLLAGNLLALARISHAIFAQLSRVARGLTSFFKGVLARVVRRTRAELGFFLSRGERQRVVSVGRGMMPRL
jgi:hypothetical protein